MEVIWNMMKNLKNAMRQIGEMNAVIGHTL